MLVGSLGAVGCWTGQDIAIDTWSLIAQFELCNTGHGPKYCPIVFSHLFPSTEECTRCQDQTGAGHRPGLKVGE